jgi:hypothetical protein
MTYHKDIFMPWEELLPFVGKTYTLKLLPHAHARRGRYGRPIVVPTELRLGFSMIVEYTPPNPTHSKAVKLLVRIPSVPMTQLDCTQEEADTDLVLVVLLVPGSSVADVVTMWHNNRHDTHATLDNSRYSKSS